MSQTHNRSLDSTLFKIRNKVAPFSSLFHGKLIVRQRTDSFYVKVGAYFRRVAPLKRYMTNEYCNFFSSVSCVTFFLLSALLMNANSSAAQKRKEPTVRCSKEALRVLKPFPALEYDCAENEDDSLKSPERKRGLRQQMKQLERFTSEEWWAANIEELNVCAAFKRPHILTRSDYIAHAYPITLEGDSQTRLVISDDPCVKRSYATLNAFVLQRAGEKVVVTQILDGYFSRADNAVSLSIADRSAERILEINVGSGGLDPYATSYLFTIDRTTNRAVPWNKIKDGKKITNEMTSCYALGVWEGKFDVKFPKSWQEMSIINNGKLADRFYVYSEGANNLARDTFVWNGSYYVLQPARGRKQSR